MMEPYELIEAARADGVAVLDHDSGKVTMRSLEGEIVTVWPDGAITVHCHASEVPMNISIDEAMRVLSLDF